MVFVLFLVFAAGWMTLHPLRTFLAVGRGVWAIVKIVFIWAFVLWIIGYASSL